MSETKKYQLQDQLRRVSLFDSYGMPWTTRLTIGWLLVVFWVTGGMAAVPIGLYLGLWIRTKIKSALVLLIYALLAGACALLFLPEVNQRWADAIGLAAVVLWFAGALVGRHQIARYYTQRAGSQFRLSLAFTLLFGVWYLNYQMRPEFPRDDLR